MKLQKSLFLFALLTTQAFAAPEFSMETPRGDMSMPTDFVMNNRVLVRVNGKPISLLDVVRKMDLIFYKQYPELSSSPIARYQFFNSSWRAVLSTVIDEQLILADAVEKKIEVTDGDVREEIENVFGPAVVHNIDKLGLSFEEARELIKTELVVQKMMGMMVRAKAMNDVSPLEVRKQYEAYVAKNPPQETWNYRILSIRSQDTEKGQSVAKKAYQLIEGQEAKLEELPLILQEMAEGVQISLSEAYERPEKELSLAYKAVLQTLAIGRCSPPIEQATKEGGSVSRIFVLENKKEVKASPFRELEDKISREITQKAIGKYNEQYVGKLRAQFGVTEKYITDLIPHGYEPFSVR